MKRYLKIATTLIMATCLFSCREEVDKTLWYSENAIPSSYGKDADGWYYMSDKERISCSDHSSAQVGY